MVVFSVGGAVRHFRAVGRGPVIGDGRVALGGIRVDDHFGFPVWPGFGHEHCLRLRRGLSHVKKYVGDDSRIGALSRCQGELTNTLDDRAVVLETAHDGVRVSILRVDPLLNRGRPRLLEPPIGVVDLPAMIVFDNVMLGRSGWGWSRRFLCGEHEGKAHCGKCYQSDGLRLE
jgi:hypothetical protein